MSTFRFHHKLWSFCTEPELFKGSMGTPLFDVLWLCRTFILSKSGGYVCVYEKNHRKKEVSISCPVQPNTWSKKGK